MWEKLKGIEESEEYRNLDTEMMELFNTSLRNAFNLFYCCEDGVITKHELNGIISDRKSLIEEAHLLSCKGGFNHEYENSVGEFDSVKNDRRYDHGCDT